MTSHMCAVLALSLLAGCASDPAPVAQMQLTAEAVAQARALGGSEQEELRLAQEGFEAARRAFAREDYRQARMLAERAELDARLAEAQILTAKSRVEIAELKARLVHLRTQLGDRP